MKRPRIASPPHDEASLARIWNLLAEWRNEVEALDRDALSGPDIAPDGDV